MTWTNSALAFVLSIAIAVPAHADETVFTPKSPWNLDGTDSGCALRRTFGTDEPPLYLEMRRFAPGDGFLLIVTGKQLSSIGRSTKLKVRYGQLPGHDEPIRFSLGGTTYQKNKAPIATIFASSDLGQPSPNRIGDTMTPIIEAQATNVALEWRDKRIVMQTGPLDKPFAIMRKCTDSLLETWGLDVEVQRTLARRVAAINQARWASEIQKVYPSDLAGMGQQARVNIIMMVDEKGKPTGCKVLSSYNNARFDTLACKGMMENAEFIPALDRAGNPVASYYTTAVNYSVN